MAEVPGRLTGWPAEDPALLVRLQELEDFRKRRPEIDPMFRNLVIRPLHAVQLATLALSDDRKREICQKLQAEEPCRSPNAREPYLPSATGTFTVRACLLSR
eukprot:CAMPEP_0177605902 /NCGR_PEP_ID=MMETSP0419_2-20121207/16981_1 /TAXON_ID=582737 /ORGANISM="Tetraselmis sp., Strain GSL018" /LENGTH=101 /DNA_ID=CAMNT_0019100147 /DNA_START=157 /DNA_END=462 /DNA_ORIENTATION=-